MSEPNACTLAIVLGMQEDPDAYEYVVDDHVVVLIDDYGFGHYNAELFLAGEEFGPSVLVHAKSFEAAWDAWIDSRPTIPQEELIEAYGVVDRDDVREQYEAGHGPCPAYHEREAWEAWHDGLKLAQTWWLAENGAEEELDLIEGYEYQSNASGTGIVYVGHYAWMCEIDRDKVIVRKKEEEDTAQTSV